PSSTSCPASAPRSRSASWTTASRTGPSRASTSSRRSRGSAPPPSRRCATGRRCEHASPERGADMTRADLRLLPGATCVWALAVLGVTAGGAAAIAAGAVLVSLALTALTLLGPARGARTILAHLALVLLAGSLLVPALHRHDGTADVLGEAAADG